MVQVRDDRTAIRPYGVGIRLSIWVSNATMPAGGGHCPPATGDVSPYGGASSGARRRRVISDSSSERASTLAPLGTGRGVRCSQALALRRRTGNHPVHSVTERDGWKPNGTSPNSRSQNGRPAFINRSATQVGRLSASTQRLDPETRLEGDSA